MKVSPWPSSGTGDGKNDNSGGRKGTDQMGRRLLMGSRFLVGGVLVCATGAAGPYRDKHGNVAELALTTPLVGAPLNGGIHVTVPYVASDVDGGKTGQYRITSTTSPGRGTTDDFVLSILVTDDRTQKGAELVLRSHPTTPPLAPIVRLLDCRTLTCTEDKRVENDEWGAFVIRNQADIATYPLELLDAHASLQLLDPSLLALLPNTTAGTGNWAEIMEHHRTLLQEAKFRADIDFLGDPQSDTLTSRIITEAGANGGALIIEHANMIHHALTFLTDHDRLIEKISGFLTNDYTWSDYSFPFGRMPAWLINADRTHTAADFDPLPTFWDRVQNPATGALRRAGCFHLFPESAFVPTLSNGTQNLGQYVCDPSPAAADGFVDRRCDQPDDYFRGGFGGLDSDMEATWHDPIHGFLGGEFAPMTTTAGTAAFWAFHTFASSIVMANWRYAQTRNMPTPVSTVDPASLIDVNFLVDLSGSFADDLPNFQNEVPALIDELASEFPAIKFSLASFQDYPIEPFGDASSGDVAYERLVDFNDQNDPDNNAGVVKNAIMNLTTRFGVDDPQSQLAALFQAVTGAGELIAPPHENASIPSGQQVHFRQQATKIILLFTDASFHAPGDPGADVPYPGPTFDQTVAAIQAADPPMVIGISSGGGGVADLQRMASATGAVAPAGGADCDADGVVDVPEGAPLVCATTATSVGIGNAVTEVINVAIEKAKVTDTDGDGLPDLQDNCPTLSNANQADLDHDSIGDGCDPDDDNDGVDDAVDNCPVLANNDQLDSDHDSLGDACDPDDDNDGILDAQDPCPLLSTPNVITGTSRNDTLRGTSGNDLIWGLGGNDTIDGRGGNDCIVGGPGNDRLSGGDGDDTLIGAEGNDKLYGDNGNDTLTGDDGNDVLVGGTGEDHLDGGRGNDTLYGDFESDDEDDRSEFGGNGDARLAGSVGLQTFDFIHGDSPITGDRGALDGTTLNSQATVTGGADVLVGGEGNDRLFGGDDDDQLSGGPGNDTLYGDEGEDEISGGPGNDSIYGGNDNDVLTGNDGDDRVSGGPGDDTLDGGIGNDLLKGDSGNDYLFGGFHMSDMVPMETDRCFGGTGTDQLVNCNGMDAMAMSGMANDDPSAQALGGDSPSALSATCAYRPDRSGPGRDRRLAPAMVGLAGLAMIRRVRRRWRHHAA